MHTISYRFIMTMEVAGYISQPGILIVLSMSQMFGTLLLSLMLIDDDPMYDGTMTMIAG